MVTILNDSLSHVAYVLFDESSKLFLFQFFKEEISKEGPKEETHKAETSKEEIPKVETHKKSSRVIFISKDKCH